MQQRDTLIVVFVLLASFSFVQSQLCSVTDEKVLMSRRMQGLRASILAQLGLQEPPIRPNVSVPQVIRETFAALSEATGSLAQERSRVCESEEIFAQPITAFVGSIEGEKVSKKRSANNPSNLLAKYTLKFDFNLTEDLSEVSRADLLLYKVPASGTVKDPIQYVEVKAVLDTIGLTTVVSSKNINIDETGFQAFDLTSAVKLWLSQNIRGNVTLQIFVQCFSSSTCSEPDSSGNKPVAVQFKDFDSKEHAPRIIVTSKNPLETSDRNKRQASGGGVKSCVANQSTCCLKPLTINFAKDLKFDFIEEPKEFQANFCEGLCPLTNSGALMTPQLYQFLRKLQGSPASAIAPCCAGNTYEDLSVLLVKENGDYAIEELKQVKVTSCRCA